MEVKVNSADEMMEFGARVGALLSGGEVIELIGDIGAGKTTFTKGVARGLQVHDDVQSPTFTISRVYQARDGLELAHYDFYRLSDPGILKMELSETAHDPHMITVIEWGEVVSRVLPEGTIKMQFVSPSESERLVTIDDNGRLTNQLREGAHDSAR